MRSLVHQYPHMRWVYYKRRVGAAAFVCSLITIVVMAIVPSSTYRCPGPDKVTARAGDNMTLIAQRECDGDIQAVVEDMIGLNRGSFIRVGQTIYLPGK